MAFQGCCRRAGGPRRHDPHQQAKITDAASKRYRKSVVPFCLWLSECDVCPVGPELWDDALVEWKNSRSISKSDFEGAVAGIEFLFPRFRGKLAWSRAVIAGRSVVHVPKHTVPMTWRPCTYIAAHFCSDGRSRLAFGLLLQRRLGLRPSEMLALQPEDCSLPEQIRSQQCRATVALGVRTDTKAKRAQAVTLRCPLLIGLLRWAIKTGVKGRPIVGYTCETYRRLLIAAQAQLGLQQLGFSPHSPRAGFATEAIADGEEFVAAREAGRWLADSSLRTYVDLARVAAVATDLELAGVAAAVDYTEAHVADFFPVARVHLFEFNDASKGLSTAPARREVLPTATDIAASGGDEASVDAPASGRGSGAARGRGRGRR